MTDEFSTATGALSYNVRGVYIKTRFRQNRLYNIVTYLFLSKFINNNYNTRLEIFTQNVFIFIFLAPWKPFVAPAKSVQRFQSSASSILCVPIPYILYYLILCPPYTWPAYSSLLAFTCTNRRKGLGRERIFLCNSSRDVFDSSLGSSIRIVLDDLNAKLGRKVEYRNHVGTQFYGFFIIYPITCNYKW